MSKPSLSGSSEAKDTTVYMKQKTEVSKMDDSARNDSREDSTDMIKVDVEQPSDEQIQEQQMLGDSDDSEDFIGGLGAANLEADGN